MKILSQNKDLQIVQIGTFPPRKCGIATFTVDLTNALSELLGKSISFKIIALNSNAIPKINYPKKVIFEIEQNKTNDYKKAANLINTNKKIALISVQHEFGIFGSDYGSKLLVLLKNLKKPSVITFHTVLPSPNPKLKSIVKALSRYVTKIVVMTNNSRDMLVLEYGIGKEKINVIPHGIHPHPFKSSEKAKKHLGFKNKFVLSTFGMLSSGKGLEFVIDALPKLVKKYPHLVYAIFGATHPNVLAQEGEKYRDFLEKKVKDLGLENNVMFFNKYLSTPELLHSIEASDIYLSTNLDPNQAVSGTLSYALGTGRPVISTAFAQAKEDITKDVGLLVNFNNSNDYYFAIKQLINDQNLRNRLGKNAYFKTRNATWPNVAISYARVFAEIAPKIKQICPTNHLPKIKIDHFDRLTDSFGMLQFAKFAEPDRTSGYTLDDNIRAILALSLVLESNKTCQEKFENSRQKKKTLNLLNNLLSFVEKTQMDSGVFINYMSPQKMVDHELNAKDSLEESNARAFLTLAWILCLKNMPVTIKNRAKQMLDKIDVLKIPESPRAQALKLIGLTKLLDNNKLSSIKNAIANLACALEKNYRCNHSPEWEWYEPFLTYSNAYLPMSMLLAGSALKNNKMMAIGKKTLIFLINNCFVNNQYSPIGQSGWYFKGKDRAMFDQQPEDAAATVWALKTAYDITKQKKYAAMMRSAFNWFLGENSLSQVLYDSSTGGCYDGLSQDRVNLNQGAESTISYLFARIAFEIE